eukprot:TRINITY_DN2735_c1_g2_i1.p1 TRINITY_DN2735_c1_g2~~TRINITY_DN2735_c1_g2_i1.p1  ORF type:complete len:367 (-),score=57.02 TRINITY_DN2735_c1_g2_i1:55-1155(-)
MESLDAASDVAGWFELFSLETALLSTALMGSIIFHRDATLYKARLYLDAFNYLTRSTDMKWKPTPDPEPIRKSIVNKEGVVIEKRTLVFIRHGESTWNYTFNKSLNPIYFIPRLLYSLLIEAYLLLTGKRDSWFYDSPLSGEGIEQADGLREFLRKHHDSKDTVASEAAWRALTTDDKENSIVVSSPLRRCLSTISVALYERNIQRVNDSSTNVFTVLPSLQEISKNLDTLAITPPHTAPVPSWVDLGQSRFDIRRIYARCDMTQWDRQKQITDTGLKRLTEFASWVFSNNKKPTVVVSGHSFWFRFFFKTFLDHSFEHDCKTLKILNGGCVELTFCCAYTESNPKEKVHWVEPTSIKAIYLGFGK